MKRQQVLYAILFICLSVALFATAAMSAHSW
jgi:hypothetical protein